MKFNSSCDCKRGADCREMQTSFRVSALDRQVSKIVSKVSKVVMARLLVIIVSCSIMVLPTLSGAQDAAPKATLNNQAFDDAFSLPGTTVSLWSSQAKEFGTADRNIGAFNHPGRLVKLAPSSSQQPPTDAECRAALGVPCYSPQEIWAAYELGNVIQAGYTGVGQTIVIIDSYGSPTIVSDLNTFDMAYGLPDPPSFQVIAPLGTVAFNPNNPVQVGWAGESTLDVEWAHAMAPGANIVLLTSPAAETQGVPGLPDFLKLEQYALDHNLGKIISQSWGTPENDLFASQEGIDVLTKFESFFASAIKANVTLLAATGDTGSTGYELDGVNLYPMRVVNYPASSPLVTAVGGTSLYATTEGQYLNETVWNSLFGEGGGGVSQYFFEPSYQQLTLPQSDQLLLNGFRGLPDLSYNADCNTPILIYQSYISPSGFYTACGTSQGPPQWAGIIADANQLAGFPLGFLNEKLYQLGGSGRLSDALHDVILSDNSVGFTVPGYFATPGWDPASGWGTPRAGKLLPLLVKGR